MGNAASSEEGIPQIDKKGTPFSWLKILAYRIGCEEFAETVSVTEVASTASKSTKGSELKPGPPVADINIQNSLTDSDDNEDFELPRWRSPTKSFTDEQKTFILKHIQKLISNTTGTASQRSLRICEGSNISFAEVIEIFLTSGDVGVDSAQSSAHEKDRWVRSVVLLLELLVHTQFLVARKQSAEPAPKPVPKPEPDRPSEDFTPDAIEEKAETSKSDSDSENSSESKIVQMLVNLAVATALTFSEPPTPNNTHNERKANHNIRYGHCWGETSTKNKAIREIDPFDVFFTWAELVMNNNNATKSEKEFNDTDNVAIAQAFVRKIVHSTQLTAWHFRYLVGSFCDHDDRDWVCKNASTRKEFQKIVSESLITVAQAVSSDDKNSNENDSDSKAVTSKSDSATSTDTECGTTQQKTLTDISLSPDTLLSALQTLRKSPDLKGTDTQPEPDKPWITYRGKNDAEIDIHKDGCGFYQGCYTMESMQRNGGVCGTVCRFGVGVCQTFGVPAILVCQPGHCAYLARTMVRQKSNSNTVQSNADYESTDQDNLLGIWQLFNGVSPLKDSTVHADTHLSWKRRGCDGVWRMQIMELAQQNCNKNNNNSVFDYPASEQQRATAEIHLKTRVQALGVLDEKTVCDLIRLIFASLVKCPWNLPAWELLVDVSRTPKSVGWLQIGMPWVKTYLEKLNLDLGPGGSSSASAAAAASSFRRLSSGGGSSGSTSPAKGKGGTNLGGKSSNQGSPAKGASTITGSPMKGASLSSASLTGSSDLDYDPRFFLPDSVVRPLGIDDIAGMSVTLEDHNTKVNRPVTNLLDGTDSEWLCKENDARIDLDLGGIFKGVKPISGDPKDSETQIQKSSDPSGPEFRDLRLHWWGVSRAKEITVYAGWQYQKEVEVSAESQTNNSQNLSNSESSDENGDSETGKSKTKKPKTVVKQLQDTRVDWCPIMSEKNFSILNPSGNGYNEWSCFTAKPGNQPETDAQNSETKDSDTKDIPDDANGVSVSDSRLPTLHQCLLTSAAFDPAYTNTYAPDGKVIPETRYLRFLRFTFANGKLDPWKYECHLGMRRIVIDVERKPKLMLKKKIEQLRADELTQVQNQKENLDSDFKVSLKVKQPPTWSWTVVKLLLKDVVLAGAAGRVLDSLEEGEQKGSVINAIALFNEYVDGLLGEISTR